MTVNKAPIVAELTVRDKNSYKLIWAIDNLPVGNANTKERAQYVGVLNTKKMTLSVKAYLSYFDNTPRGSGKCTILKDK